MCMHIKCNCIRKLRRVRKNKFDFQTLRADVQELRCMYVCRLTWVYILYLNVYRGLRFLKVRSVNRLCSSMRIASCIFLCLCQCTYSNLFLYSNYFLELRTSSFFYSTPLCVCMYMYISKSVYVYMCIPL